MFSIRAIEGYVEFQDFAKYVQSRAGWAKYSDLKLMFEKMFDRSKRGRARRSRFDKFRIPPDSTFQDELANYLGLAGGVCQEKYLKQKGRASSLSPLPKAERGRDEKLQRRKRGQDRKADFLASLENDSAHSSDERRGRRERRGKANGNHEERKRDKPRRSVADKLRHSVSDLQEQFQKRGDRRKKAPAEDFALPSSAESHASIRGSQKQKRRQLPNIVSGDYVQQDQLKQRAQKNLVEKLNLEAGDMVLEEIEDTVDSPRVSQRRRAQDGFQGGHHRKQRNKVLRGDYSSLTELEESDFNFADNRAVPKELFKDIDQNGSNFITFPEFTHWLQESASWLKKEQIQFIANKRQRRTNWLRLKKETIPSTVSKRRKRKNWLCLKKESIPSTVNKRRKR